jgi:REP element-mobilizing transposase RayT
LAKRHSRDAVTSRLRLRDYDYSTPGDYFVTICTARRDCLFGDVNDGQVVLSTAGLMVESWWHSIPRRFPTVLLEDIVVMPNHLHGIVELGACAESEADHALPSLSDIMYWFKSITTNDYILGVRTLNWPAFPGKLWQERYHDHIIRSETALNKIRDYIAANPSQWENDENNPRRGR